MFQSDTSSVGLSQIKYYILTLKKTVITTNKQSRINLVYYPKV